MDVSRLQKTSKLKARRVFRSRKRKVDEFAETASQHIDRHIFRRINNFASVARFMIAWLLLVIVLIAGVVYQTRALGSYYLSTQPTSGGIITEGIVGTYTTPNPVFATSTVDLSVSKLVFNGLLTYDDNGQLANDLASDVKRSDDGLTYDVAIKKNCFWQDGKKLTADDVVYTIQAIQNPDTKSPYGVGWLTVKVSKVNDYAVRFVLPSPLNSFPLSLTMGILPSHVLAKTPYSQLRSSTFNSNPIGSGPFSLSRVVRLDDFNSVTKRQRIEFVKNNSYFHGTPKLDAYVLYALASDDDVRLYLQDRRIDAGIFTSKPDLGGDENNYTVTSIPLLAGAYTFFNTSKAPLDSKELRQALVMGTDVNKLLSSLGYPVQTVKSPLLSSDIGFDTALTQLGYDKAKANQTLDSLGWVRAKDGGPRHKDKQTLEISLTTLEGSDFAVLASSIQQMWLDDLGVKLNVVVKSSSDIQTIMLQHAYDAIIYGISMGADPDVYAYWHSSQAVADRYNLSVYKSAAADQALESGRSRPDIALRAVKYRPLLESWRDDAPAIGLYQPPLFYASRVKIYGFEPKRLNTSAERYYNVYNWQVLTSKQPIVK